MLAKSDGHIVSQMFENSEKRIEDHLDEVIYCEALMKNGYVRKNSQIHSIDIFFVLSTH